MIIEYALDGIDDDLGYHSPYIFGVKPEGYCCSEMRFNSNDLDLRMTSKGKIILLLDSYKNILWCPWCGGGIIIQFWEQVRKEEQRK